MVLCFLPVEAVPYPRRAGVELAELEGSNGCEGDALVCGPKDDVEWEGIGGGGEEVGEDGLSVGGGEGGQ